jgi:hypothetical protein
MRGYLTFLDSLVNRAADIAQWLSVPSIYKSLGKIPSTAKEKKEFTNILVLLPGTSPSHMNRKLCLLRETF